MNSIHSDFSFECPKFFDLNEESSHGNVSLERKSLDHWFHFNHCKHFLRSEFQRNISKPPKPKKAKKVKRFKYYKNKKRTQSSS